MLDRAEGLALLAGALGLYFHGGYSWVLLVALFLAPDVAFGAYLAGPRVGAAGYNFLHSIVLPIALGVAGLAVHSDTPRAIALIWLAHIGADRLLGYGFKDPTRQAADRSMRSTWRTS